MNDYKQNDSIFFIQQHNTTFQLSLIHICNKHKVHTVISKRSFNNTSVIDFPHYVQISYQVIYHKLMIISQFLPTALFKVNTLFLCIFFYPVFKDYHFNLHEGSYLYLHQSLNVNIRNSWLCKTDIWCLEHLESFTLNAFFLNFISKFFHFLNKL